MLLQFTARYRRIGLLLGVIFLTCCIFSACKNKDETPPPSSNMYTLSATLSGTAEVPPNASTATGTLTGTYNATTYQINYTLSWSNLSGVPTAMHFHGPAAAGANASVALGIASFPSNATSSITGQGTLTAEQSADLLAGKWYANIHTAAYGGGEIRGQVTATKN